MATTLPTFLSLKPLPRRPSHLRLPHLLLSSLHFFSPSTPSSHSHSCPHCRLPQGKNTPLFTLIRVSAKKMSKKIVEPEDEIEGNIVETNDYIFDKIGEPVPIKSDGFTFDPQSSPSRPLAVSEKHAVVFVAHSSGFFVARTKDVMASAAEIKEKGSSASASASIEEVSVVDVPLANLQILSLSTDNSTLAATADAHIHFFSVGSLLDKGLEPSYSCSLDESSSVKDMQWSKKPENMYVLLSNLGKLYSGTIGGPLKDLMDNVDAVGWSVKGNLIAVARKDTLNILSSNFIEQSSMPLSFKSWISHSDTNCIIKVDTIRWVRCDSIILGCFQLNADGNEENYLVQVIQTRGGKFTNQEVTVPHEVLLFRWV